MAIGDADTTNTTTVEIQSTIDVSSSFYIHPCNSPGLVLVPVPFDGLGYRSWRRGVLRSLCLKNKLGFITRECVKPNSNSSSFRQWERCDDMVTSWILNSLAKEIADSVKYVNTSFELWR
ncbi:uncharacterized protein LOC142181981 [Nicotiana tabacum]|uniref:Uncharacterized protein LOC142181981 n=1 Tax=Nicotiana tabacum TaxID=4097 RepID=A0AC58UQR2_TOBAC